MSEDFDKEAEREKLREQFERDEKRREATRKMSDLLLKGATMTNRHCDRCGNPIFRYEGQEFCAECQTTVGGEGEVPDGAAEGGDASAARSTTEADGTAADEAGSADPDDHGGEGRTESGPSTDPAATTDVAGGGMDAEPSGGTSTPTDPESDHPTVRPDRDEGSPRRSESRTTPPIDSTDVPARPETEDLPDAQASLQQTLTRFAARAADTDDPRQAREYLAAAREAAEALAALRR